MKTIEQAAIEYENKEPDVIDGEYTSFSIINAFKAGVEFAQRWIPVEEELPVFDNTKYPNGDFEKYEVKFCTGGMSPKYFIQISHLIREDKFSGEFDWTQATHWRPIEYK